MKKKKHDLNYHTRKTVFSMYWIQIASLLTFYMVYFIFKCFFEYDYFLEQLALSIVVEATICYMAYKKTWALGDFHAGEVITGATQLRKYRALWVGLFMVAPIIVCALFSSLLRAVGVNLGIFETVLNLFVFRWSGVVEYISRWSKGSAIVGIVFYVVACAPLVVTSYYGFRNGFIGIYEGIVLRKRHCERYENEGAREIWNKV